MFLSDRQTILVEKFYFSIWLTHKINIDWLQMIQSKHAKHAKDVDPANNFMRSFVCRVV